MADSYTERIGRISRERQRALGRNGMGICLPADTEQVRCSIMRRGSQATWQNVDL